MFSSNASQVSTAANYVEDVFSTYLYTAANQVAKTITNGINLSEKGGLVWIKTRSAAYEHFLADTVRGAANYLQSQSTAAQINNSTELTSFNSNGFSIGTDSSGIINFSSTTLVSWTFRKQAKFFDVVTYTGNGANRTIAHNLGSAPGFMVVKRLDLADQWFTYHRSLGSLYGLPLNSSDAASTWYPIPTIWNSTNPTSTYFAVGTDSGVNANGGTYVAYLFAHDAGGFGAAGTDNVISCGSFTTDGSGNATVSLGYEPQWVMIKASSAVEGWEIGDNMRGLPVSGTYARLRPNLSNAEDSSGELLLTNTGFRRVGVGASVTYIYIAIRRGPMKTPTSGTSVFSPIASSAATGTALTTGFPVDAQILSGRSTSATKQVFDRLRGVSSTTTESGIRLITSSTAAEAAASNTRLWDNTGFQMPSFFGGISTVFWNFRRAPGFFDVVCYTGNGSTQSITHNLSVIPEWVIIKQRNGVNDWMVLNGMTASQFKYTFLNQNDINYTTSYSSTEMFASQPSATTFSLGNHPSVNSSSNTYVAYLFATVAGVSKVGSYTGTGTTQQINCAFTGGARFVLIKRTDSTGDWYVWDSARGIVAGNDPYLLLNSTAAEVTGTDYVDTYSAGFEISSTAPTAINANGGSFIFLAIA